MGSGTTGKMALLNGRNFIGIEKVEEYYEVASKRINESIKDL
jgi:site-specific DNA-methyltransferase (adenine-specific)